MPIYVSPLEEDELGGAIDDRESVGVAACADYVSRSILVGLASRGTAFQLNCVHFGNRSLAVRAPGAVQRAHFLVAGRRNHGSQSGRGLTCFNRHLCSHFPRTTDLVA